MSSCGAAVCAVATAGLASTKASSRRTNMAILVQQMRTPRIGPRRLIGPCDRIEIARAGSGIMDPLAQSRSGVDHVDRELVELVFIREIAPQVVVRVERADRLE